jgi:hypothetical protein
MKNVKSKEQITNIVVNTVFILQRSKDDMLGVLVESTTVFAWSLKVFTQSLELWA